MENKNKIAGQYITLPANSSRKFEGGIRLQQQFKTSQNKLPLVSIITVSFNAEDSLEETIKSVLNQTYQNIEYIIIDGGSTDNSLSILKKYESFVDYIVSEPDDGIYNAMNKGIALAQGDYIALLNSGDYYLKEFIEESVNTALSTNADLTYCAMRWNGVDRYPTGINSGILMHHLNINHMTFLAKKETYDHVGPYSEEFKLFSDDLWTRTAYTKGMDFVLIPELLVVFSGGGLSHGDSLEKRKAIFFESSTIAKRFFPFLTETEAEELIMSRFNIAKIDTLIRLFNRYSSRNELFRDSLHNYLSFMLLNRENYIFDNKKSNQYLEKFVMLSKKLDIPLRSFKFNLENLNPENIMTQIEQIKKESNKGQETILHFVSQFSLPSETFIYDLVNRLEKYTEYNNIILCDERLLEEIRPYSNCICINYEKLPSAIRDFLYQYVFTIIKPNVIISHFAINGYKIYKRLEALNIKIPMVHMTHGIDVFTISTKKDYRDFIINKASNDPYTMFTAVSQYLQRELVDRGVPIEKTKLVHNVVHERFFQHRKESDFFDFNRKLELLSVGRLVDWKGHHEIIIGLDYIVKNIYSNTHLTIVYGKSDNEKGNLVKLTEQLDLKDNVTFVEFVNFDEKPDYFKNFDIFISASKYTGGVASRSETFGMSTLEAISSGLLVIVTDAGGSPEVVGTDNSYAKVVPHNDGIAIGKAIESYLQDRNSFSDNIEYAKERLSVFSKKEQITKLVDVIKNVCTQKLKIGIFSSLIQGGAGKAASRVHKALLKNDLDSHFFTRNNNQTVPLEPNYNFLSSEISFHWDQIQSSRHIKRGSTIFSLNEPGLDRETLKRLVLDMDVINIQWIARFLSAEDIGFLSNLGKPLVITLRDMNPITGGCHFFHGCDQWQDNCFACPQLLNDEDDFPSKVLEIKKKYWNIENISFISLSEHSKKIIQQSALYENNNIEVIGNPIELEIFKPTSKDEARKHYKIDSPYPILFYVPSYGSTVKGSKELKEALKYIKSKYPDFKLTLLMAGSATTLIDEVEFSYPIVHLGSFRDDTLLAKAYSAADATVIPSLEETFSNTAAESISCGRPIIGFKTGAIPEISGDGKRGQAVKVGDIHALGEAIYKVLNNQISADVCRKFAVENFDFKIQGKKYTQFFNELVTNNTSEVKINPNNIPMIDNTISVDLFKWGLKSIKLNNNNHSNKEKYDDELKKVQKKFEEKYDDELKKVQKKFDKLCSTSTIKSPLVKIQSYKELICIMHEANNNLSNVNKKHLKEFIESFDNLCSVKLTKNPIKKLRTYKNMIAIWHKLKHQL